MTIIAGFKCNDGVVLCADTQETMSIGDVGVSKRKVPKLKFEERSPFSLQMSGLTDMAVAICGAGYGPFIDKMADELWKTANACDNLDDACYLMEKRIKDIYTEFGQIYQQGRCPEVELLYGIKSGGSSRLFYANGPLVNEKSDYCAAGTGTYMADFIASNMQPNAINVSQCVVIAAYILFQTKEHADGCGGDSHIAVLRESESSGRVGWNRVESLTRLVENSHIQVGRLLMDHGNLSISDEEFAKQAMQIVDGMKNTRQREREIRQSWDEMWSQMFSGMEFDDLGLIDHRRLAPAADPLGIIQVAEAEDPKATDAGAQEKKNPG